MFLLRLMLISLTSAFAWCTYKGVQLSRCTSKRAGLNNSDVFHKAHTRLWVLCKRSTVICELCCRAYTYRALCRCEASTGMRQQASQDVATTLCHTLMQRLVRQCGALCFHVQLTLPKLCYMDSSGLA